MLISSPNWKNVRLRVTGVLFAALALTFQTFSESSPEPKLTSFDVPGAIATAATGINGRAFFCGEWRAETEAILHQALGERARFASPVATRRAAWLAELASARLRDGAIDNPATIEPLYLRKPAITISKKAGIPLQDPQQPTVQARASASQEQPAGSEDAPHALRR